MLTAVCRGDETVVCECSKVAHIASWRVCSTVYVGVSLSPRPRPRRPIRHWVISPKSSHFVRTLTFEAPPWITIALFTFIIRPVLKFWQGYICFQFTRGNFLTGWHLFTCSSGKFVGSYSPEYIPFVQNLFESLLFLYRNGKLCDGFKQFKKELLKVQRLTL